VAGVFWEAGAGVGASWEAGTGAEVIWEAEVPPISSAAGGWGSTGD